MPLFILFILFPILELWAFVAVSGEIGFFLALCLLIIAGVTGSALIRHQGFRTILSMHDSMERGKMPTDALFDEFCITAAAILLVFPGFISDAIAIFLLVPRLRTVLRAYVRKHPDWYYEESEIIEAEYEKLDNDPKSLT